MKKLGTTLLLALSLMSFTACGKKDNNNNAAYNCGGQYGYQTTQCNGQYGQYGQYGQQQYGQQCQAGAVQTQYGCLQQGPCMSGYGYHPTALNGGPGCVQGSNGGYQQPYQQQQYGGAYGGVYGGGF